MQFAFKLATAVVITMIVSPLAVGQSAVPTRPSAPEGSGNDPMLRLLTQRVEERPEHSDSWRLLGNYHGRIGNADAALDAFTRALQLDPSSAAAHHDLGRLYQQQNDSAAAERHFQLCRSLAPQSEYVESLVAEGLVDPPELLDQPIGGGSLDVSSASLITPTVSGTSGEASEVDPVGYRIQTFDGEDDLQQRFQQLESQADPSLQRLRLFVETGLLYNSNVSLTPISRELANSGAESFQAIFNPDLEYVARENAPWRAGVLSRGFFTINEASQSAFDLASFQPGAFVERDATVGSQEWIGRLEYVYALDLLDSERVGDRHSVTGSLIAIRPDLDVVYLYFTAARSQFDNDGFKPSKTSLDGDAYTAGVSRFFQTDFEVLTNWNLGFDLEHADTEGSDFRYRAITGHAEGTYQLHPAWQWIPGGGLGFRDYYAFTGPVSRDELTWRIQSKLRWQWREAVSISLVAGHDRFASDNNDFDAARTQGGIILTLQR